MSSIYLPDLQQGEQLENFIDRHLRPPKEFLTYMLQSVDKVVRHLHQLSSQNSYRHYSIKKIVKSGSLGKGTSYRQTADVDLVVFFNGYKNMESFLRDKGQIIRDIKRYMCNTDPELWRWFGWLRSGYQPGWTDGIRVVRTTDYHVEFEVQMEYNRRMVTVNMDILPTIDIIDMHRSISSDHLDYITSVYDEIKSKSPQVQGHYSVCFCERQIRLYNGNMSKVKDLVRLLKYWRTSNGLKLKSYGCEVLALWVYKNQLNEKPSFKMLTGFKVALQVLSNMESNDVVPSNTDIDREYLDCFTDPANPYSSTLPYYGIENIRTHAGLTLRYLDDGTVEEPEEEGMCLVM